MQVPITKEAQREEELSKSDFISLSFSAACKIILPVGAYIVHTYYIDQTRKVTQRFSLLEPYEPVQTDEMSWKYTPEFQHPKMVLGKIPFYIKTKNSQNETIKQTNWTFVGTPDVIMGKICDFLNNDIQFGKCGWKSVLSGELKNSLSVSFSDNDVLSALSSIANAEGDTCEWHIDYDNEDIYLGNVVLDEVAVPLEVGRNIGTPSVTESKENYYNAYTVFGGTRNITQTNSLGENVSSSDIRLQLASGKGIVSINGKEVEYTVDDFSTIDLRKDKTKEPLLTKVLNFSDVFPSLNTYVYKVRGRQKYVLDDTTKKKIPLTYNADGSVATYKTFTVWYMRLAYCTTTEDKTKKLVNKTVDDGVTHYWYDFEITDNLIVNGKTLSCSFEANTNINALSTPLAGRGTNGEHVGFELKYHKDNYSAHDSDDVDSANFNILSGDYEIIYQEDNNLIIPTNEDERLIPRGESLPSLSCNITVLYNIAMSEQYQKDAQEKLLDKAIKEIERLNSDLNNYEFSVYPQVFEANNPRLQIGQKVKYSDGQGYTLDTRILKLTTNLDYDFIQEISVGNQANKGTVTQLKDDVQTIIANSSNGNGSSYSGSQFNSIVSKYGSKYFLSKQYDDIAQGQIRFMKGLKIGDGEKGVDAKGNAKLADAVLSDVIVDRVHDVDSTPADRVVVGAKGFDLYLGEDGKSHLYIDFLVARVKAFFAQLEIRRVSYSGGTTIFSNAGSTIAKVMELKNGNDTVAYKCYAVADDGTTKTMNWWHVGMMALCQTFNVKSGTSNDVSNRYYWRLVVDTGQEVLADGKTYDYVVLSNVNEFFGNGTVHGDIRPLSALSEEYDNTTNDDNNTTVASRMFYGYEAVDGGEPNAPAEGDVIVQVGDQIRWKSYGNVIKLATSTEDNNTGDAPSITMYHGIGAPRMVGTAVTPYVWQEVTCILSPGKVRINADMFELFSGSTGNVIEPYVVSYELVPTSRTLVKHDDGTTTPNGFGVDVIKRVGSSKTVLKADEYTVKAKVTYEDGNTETLSLADLYESVLRNLTALKLVACSAKDATDVLAETDIAVLSDGKKGADGKPGVDGNDGANGVDGEAGVDIYWTPNPLVIKTKTDSNGNVSAVLDENRAAQVMFFRDGINWGYDHIVDFFVYETRGCSALAQKQDNGLFVIIEGIASQEITTSEGKTITVPVTTASVTVAAKYWVTQSAFTHIYATLTVNVDVSAVWGGLKMDMRGLTTQYNEISGKYNDLPLKTPGQLTEYTSTIKQTARDISLKVSETAVGRKNLLPGSALRRQGEGVFFAGDAFISNLEQYNGVNSIRCSKRGFTGLKWYYNPYTGGRNVKVEKGKKYHFSVMAKATVPISIALEAVWTNNATSADTAEGYKGPNGGGWIGGKILGVEWERVEGVITVQPDAPYEYIQVDILSNLDKDGAFYLCQPMLVEGDEYVGWSLSEEDAEYIGGNLLNNTDTLVQGGNLVIASGNLYTDANSYKGFPTRQVDMLNATETNKVVLQWDLESDSVLRQGQDYMLSFWAKGKGVFDILFYKDGNQSIFVEKSNDYGGNTSTDTYGTATIKFKDDYSWQQYWVHWRVMGSNLPKYVLIRCPKGTDMYVSQPKLEYGATVTEYRATKTDYIEDKSVAGKLLDAGIDVDSKEITLTADKTNFRTRSGQKVAVFDENGLNADLINAKHVWAKSENGKNTVGHFGNYEPDFCKVSDNVFAPLFVGSDTAAKAPFYVTSTGAIKATAGYIGDFTIKGGSLVNEYDKKSMRLGGSNIIFENTSEGKFDLKMGSSVLSEVVGVNTQGGLYLNMKRNYPTSTTSGSETQVNMGLLLNVSGTMDKASREHPWIVNSDIPNGNHAIFIGQGDIAGFRPMLTKAKTSRAISKMECVIVCFPPQNANIILTLPDDPEIGQHYTFIQRNGEWKNNKWGHVIIKSNQGSGYPITRYNADRSWSFEGEWIYNVIQLWFTGDEWILQWHNQSW